MRRKPQKSLVSRIDIELKPLLRQIGRSRRNIHPEIWSRWPDIVGAELAIRAVPRFFRNKILFIAVANSSWLHELSFLKKRLVERVAEEIGPGQINDIRFVLDHSLTQKTPAPEPEKPAPPKIKPVLDAKIVAAIDAVDDPALREAIKKAVLANWSYAPSGSSRSS